MALIKSNKLIQQGISVVAGNQVIPDGGVFVPDPTLERLVPQSEPEGEEYQEPSDFDSLETPEEFIEEFPEEPEPLPMIDLGEADTAVAEMLQQEQEAFAQIEMNMQAEIPMEMGNSLENLQQATVEQISEVYADPAEAEEVMGRMMPYLEHQASAEAEETLLPQAQALKWQEMATVEEKIQTYLEQYSRQYTEAPEDQLLQILAEKEQILAQARIQAQDVLQQAEARAAHIVAEAEAKATQTMQEVENTRQQIVADLEQQGYAQGYQEGRGQADQEGAEILSEAIETLNRVRMAYPKAIKDNEDKLLKLAIEIAERIIGEELTLRPEICQSMLEIAIRKVSDLEQVIIKSSEEDLPIILEKEEYFRELLKNVKNLEFVSSKKVGRGGVLIETTAGMVDAQISTQLSVLKEAFDRLRAEYAEDPSDQAWEEVDQ